MSWWRRQRWALPKPTSRIGARPRPSSDTEPVVSSSSLNAVLVVSERFQLGKPARRPMGTDVGWFVCSVALNGVEPTSGAVHASVMFSAGRVYSVVTTAGGLAAEVLPAPSCATTVNAVVVPGLRPLITVVVSVVEATLVVSR